MALNHPTVGEGYVSAYQISATPFVTSSQVSLGQIEQIEFGSVTKFFTIRNTGASSNVISVAFTERGFLPENSNYFFLSGSESFSSELRTDRIFLSGSSGASTTFTLIAGLTQISPRNFLLITGSNGFSGVG